MPELYTFDQLIDEGLLDEIDEKIKVRLNGEDVWQIARNYPFADTETNIPEYPSIIDKWNWGAFCFSWVWALFNGLYWPLIIDGFLDDLHQHLLVFRQCGGDAAVFRQVGQACGFLNGEELLAVADHLLEILFVRAVLESKVKIVKKGVAFKSYIYEAGVEPRHQFLDLCRIDVSNRKRCLSGFVLVFHQVLILKQGYRYGFRLDIDN